MPWQDRGQGGQGQEAVRTARATADGSKQAGNPEARGPPPQSQQDSGETPVTWWHISPYRPSPGMSHGPRRVSPSPPHTEGTAGVWRREVSRQV